VLNDMEAFEVLPHGMRWVGDSAMREGIGCKQKTEFVMPHGYGHAPYWNQSEANNKGAQANGDDCNRLSPGKLGKSAARRQKS
jgi:hypothetical protein